MPDATSFDGVVQHWVIAHQSRALHALFVAITIGGGINAMRLLALGAAIFLWIRRRRVAAAIVALTPVVAVPVSDLIKRELHRARPAGLGGTVDSSYAFPSGHATVSAAVCCAIAYAFWREGITTGRVSVALATIVPLVVGASRVYLNVHWATDVIGGWCIGILIALLGGMAHDRYAKHHRVSGTEAA